MSDRKAELERKKAKLQAMREEKKRKEKEKQKKEVNIFIDILAIYIELHVNCMKYMISISSYSIDDQSTIFQLWQSDLCVLINFDRQLSDHSLNYFRFLFNVSYDGSCVNRLILVSGAQHAWLEDVSRSFQVRMYRVRQWTNQVFASPVALNRVIHAWHFHNLLFLHDVISCHGSIFYDQHSPLA